MDLLLLELEAIGFPMLADWIHEGEITSFDEALRHLKENKHMIDDEDDEKAFIRAEKIAEIIFLNLG